MLEEDMDVRLKWSPVLNFLAGGFVV